jgi:multidrug efflux pump subunit AcrA (membrane-fusion protein)
LNIESKTDAIEQITLNTMNDENAEKITDKPKEVPESPEITADAENQADSESEENSAPARKKFLIIGGIVAAVFLLIFGYLYLERQKQADVAATSASTPADASPDVVVSVKVAKADKQTITKDVSALATVAPLEQSNVSASISAQIKQMRLLKNQYVRQGEILAVLASQDLEAQKAEATAALEEARLNLQTLQKVTIPQTAAQNQKDLSDAKAAADNARATYERRKDLYAKGGLPLKELEASGLALQNAENALRLAQSNKSLNSSAVNPNSKAIAESRIKQAQDRVNTIGSSRADFRHRDRPGAI